MPKAIKKKKKKERTRGKKKEEGKEIEGGPKPWAPIPSWKTRNKLLAPGSRLAQLQPLRPFQE